MNNNFKNVWWHKAIYDIYLINDITFGHTLF